VKKLKKRYISLVKSIIRCVSVVMDRKYFKDLLHNVRDFWNIYKGRKKQCTIKEIYIFVSHFQKLYGAANAAGLPQLSRCEAPGAIGDDCSPDLGSIKGPQSSHPVHPESTLRSNLLTLNEHFSHDKISGTIKELGNDKSTSDMPFLGLFKYAKGKDEKDEFTAEVLLAPCLCAMFNQAFDEGLGVPNSWPKASTSYRF
jgi:hypothetical protein